MMVFFRMAFLTGMARWGFPLFLFYARSTVKILEPLLDFRVLVPPFLLDITLGGSRKCLLLVKPFMYSKKMKSLPGKLL